jgi:dynein heavy chain
MRCTPPGKPISVSGTNDSEVLFGEINENTVFTLNTVVNSVYKPLVDKLDGADWGSCEPEQKREFMQTFDRFAKEVREAIQSLASNITLEPYNPIYTKDALNIQNTKSPNQEMITDFEKIFNEWSEKIEQTLEEAEAERKDDKDAGPRQELEYWKQRMRKLTCVSEQLRSKNCRTVFDVLSHASSSANDNSNRPRDKIYLATSKWRSIELRVTEALNEAKDNVKYLQTLEKFIEPLYDGNPESIKDTLPALMNSIKMIHTIARYYNTNERMTGLFIRITNQMITNCRFNIINFRRIKQGLNPVGQLTPAQIAQGKKAGPVDDTVLWDHELYPPDELISMLQQCLDLHEAYVKQYEFTKERLQNVPKAKQFDFNPTQIFGKFDLFCRRITKLKELFSTIKQFQTLGKHNLENIQPIITQFQYFVAQFKKKNHKLLDFNNNTFDRDFVEFNVDVSSVETILQKYIDKNFEVISNIEEHLKLLRKFKTIIHRDNLRQNLAAKYAILFQHYQVQIVSIEEQYHKNKSSPPIVRNLPTVSGSITWSRHLFHRISVPMEQFPPEFPKQRDYKRPVKQYNKIGYTLFSYEYLWR